MLADFGPRLAPATFVFGFLSQLKNIGDVGSCDLV